MIKFYCTFCTTTEWCLKLFSFLCLFFDKFHNKTMAWEVYDENESYAIHPSNALLRLVMPALSSGSSVPWVSVVLLLRQTRSTLDAAIPGMQVHAVSATQWNWPPQDELLNTTKESKKSFILILSALFLIQSLFTYCSILLYSNSDISLSFFIIIYLYFYNIASMPILNVLYVLMNDKVRIWLVKHFIVT